jgi:hypothetical protein
MSPSHPHQAGDGLCGHLHETGRRPHAPACPPLADAILGFGLRALGMEHGGATALRACLPAGPTTQQAHTVMAIDLTDDSVACPGTLPQVAFGIDPR